MKRWRAAVVACVVGWICPLILGLPARPAAATPWAHSRPLVLAHFYIWFDSAAWQRAKKDYPLIGRYSSDDAQVMAHQISQAKSAGIDGFIVSWKDTPTLTPRLEMLTAEAAKQDFKLAITYQGLTFDRTNLPPEKIAGDLDTFTSQFAGNPVFDIFGKPLVVITGTPGMTVDQVKLLTEQRRSSLLILASEKSVAGYERLASVVDGNLYYWSSAQPRNIAAFETKLATMGRAVRDHDGLWISPVAPGFDARMIGGRTVVPRADGATLRAEWAASVASLPAGLGIISWNEFSENTYVEPSEKYGDFYLRQVAALTMTASDDATGGAAGRTRQKATAGWTGGLFATAAAGFFVVSTVLATRRRRGRHRLRALPSRS